MKQKQLSKTTSYIYLVVIILIITTSEFFIDKLIKLLNI